VTIVLFLIPNSLVTAELGTSYPEQGGIYAWVRDAFGPRWAARITWLYWINIALWVPSVFIMFSGMTSAMFFPDMSLWTQIGIGIFLCALVGWINCMPLSISKWVPILATPLKFIVILVFGAAGLRYGFENGFANDMSFGAAIDDLGSGLAYIPVLVYGCLGLELIMAESNSIKQPEKCIPKSMIIAGLVTAAFYIFGTAGILAAIPAEDVEIVSIFAVTLRELFGETPGGQLTAVVLAIAALYTFFGTMVAWTLGGNAAMAEAGIEKEMPAVFGIVNKDHGAPVGSAILTCIVSGLILVIYGFMATSAEELFWTLFSFSAIIFLMPYIAMHLAFVKLRNRDPDHKRPFKIPGGMGSVYLFASLCILILTMSIFLFFWVPGDPLDFGYIAQVGVGLIITFVVGEALVKAAEGQTGKGELATKAASE
ncbi:MAG: amino acid permease, partial [Holophagae bacterium]|nr:amino acid permease [Holophagae bacterium]